MIGSEATPREAALAVQLLEASPDGLLLVDPHGRISLANRSAASMFGYVDGSLVGISVDDLVPDEQRQRHAEQRHRYEQHPETRAMGTGLRLFAQHRTGDTFPVEISLSPITIDGEVQIAATIRDVTEREAQLLRNQDRLRIAADLHDLVIQRLFGAGLSLQSVTNLIESPVARDRVSSVTDNLDETVRAIRAAIFSIGSSAAPHSLTSHLNSVVHERSRHRRVHAGALDRRSGRRPGRLRRRPARRNPHRGGL